MAIRDGWELVVGLEVHCELLTQTKLFCGCRNAFGEEPNTNVCPVCLGLPGSLPVLNERAVEYAMRIGAALGCAIKPSVFHRKNYFYPDMPKDYQVSQYDAPINLDGRLELPDGSVVGITRAHMEEDTGKTSHLSSSGRIHGAEASLVDYNRAGVPLVEIVSEPDIRSAEQARLYVEELRGVLVATGAADGKMEEGSMRVDANVSVRRPGAEFGTRCEIKNLNSLRSLVRAIEYEANRQIDLIGHGESVVQETRHWNEDDGRTSSMRSKEEAMDYRYFQEPDLVPLDPSADWIASIRSALPLMPAARRARLAALSGASLESGDAPVVTVVGQGLDDLVVAAVEAGADGRIAVQRAANELAGLSIDELARITPATFAALVQMEAGGKVTATQAKAILAEMASNGGEPAAIASAKGFEAMADDAMGALVDELIAAHPPEFERLRNGDAKVTGFFVGAAMKATGGKADGKALTALLRSRAGL
jgi:aspartyl-tRNA(Asn)/glutamyl-tRNA(Gln) amidotransferase subunit B